MKLKQLLENMRGHEVIVDLVAARGIMTATLLSDAPEIFDKRFADGSTFRVSDSFVQKWLHDALHWSRRKGTQAVQKMPVDWED